MNWYTVKTAGQTERIETVKAELIRRSLQGGAWVFVPEPFSPEIQDKDFKQYRSPSAIPDNVIDISWPRTEDARIGWQGKLVPFSTAARIREQNRGYSGDR